SQLRETETAGDLCDVRGVGIGFPQRAAYFPQPTQQHIPGWAHAYEFGTARPKGAVAHPDQLAEPRNIRRLAEMFRQYLLESDHYTGVMACCEPVGPRAGGSQTADQHLDQILLKGPCDLG